MEQYIEVLMALACALFALWGVGELAHNLRLVLTGLLRGIGAPNRRNAWR
jgi:hypothetical protein